MSEMIGRTLEGYRIDAEIGRGGQAIVYRATQLSLQRTVALKVVTSQYSSDPGFRERFRLEGISAARLEHPHIVPVYEAGEADGLSFLAMKYVEGTSADGLVRSRGALPIRRAIGILRQIGDALDHADGLGIVHRDVKPANILLGPADHAYLSDFGLARAIESAGLTQSGTWLGTLEYVAPEQISGDEISSAADRYALAMVANEMLTGSPAFRRESKAAMLYAHLHDAPEPPSTLRPALGPLVDEVIVRGLAKTPGDRYPSAAEFVDALQGAVDATPGAAGAPPPPPAPGGAPGGGALRTTAGPQPVTPETDIEPVPQEAAAESPLEPAAPSPAVVADGAGDAPPEPEGRAQGPPGSGPPEDPAEPIWRRPKILIAAGGIALAVVLAVVLSVVFIGGGGDGDSPGTTTEAGPIGPGGTEQLLPTSIEGWDLAEVQADGVLGIDPGPEVDQRTAQATRGGEIGLVSGLAPSGGGSAGAVLSDLRASIGGERLDALQLPNGETGDLNLSGGAFLVTYESAGRAYVVLAGTRQSAVDLANAMGGST